MANVFKPIAIIRKDKSSVFIRCYFVDIFLIHIQRRVYRLVMFCESFIDSELVGLKDKSHLESK